MSMIPNFHPGIRAYFRDLDTDSGVNFPVVAWDAETGDALVVRDSKLVPAHDTEGKRWNLEFMNVQVPTMPTGHNSDCDCERHEEPCVIMTNDYDADALWMYLHHSQKLVRQNPVTDDTSPYFVPEQPNTLAYILAVMSDEDGHVQMGCREFHQLAGHFYQCDAVEALDTLAEKKLIEPSGDRLWSAPGSTSKVHITVTEGGRALKRQMDWDAQLRQFVPTLPAD